MSAKKIISICKKIIKSKGLELPDIKKALEPKSDLEKNHKIYKSLYQFNAIYVTTNYDKLLDKVAHSNREDPVIANEKSEISQPEEIEQRFNVIFKKKDLLTSNLKNGMVLHIHGSVDDPDEIVATLVDYMNHYERGSNPNELLDKIFNSHTVLFIGYGLEELEIIEYLLQKLRYNQNKMINHYILYPFFKNEKKLVGHQNNYYIDLGVEMIPYSIDKIGYAQLALIIKDWSSKIGPLSKPKNYYENIKLIDEVL